MTLSDFQKMLAILGKSLKIPVERYHAFKQQDKYIVWAEDSQSDSVWGDDIMVGQTLEGTVDYFTKAENDPNVTEIQKALNNGEISWRLNSVQFEKETKYIHYEWVVGGLRHG